MPSKASSRHFEDVLENKKFDNASQFVVVKHIITFLADMSTKAAAKNKIYEFYLVDELHCHYSRYKSFIFCAKLLEGRVLFGSLRNDCPLDYSNLGEASSATVTLSFSIIKIEYREKDYYPYGT